MQLHSLEADASQSGCAQAEGLFIWLAQEGRNGSVPDKGKSFFFYSVVSNCRYRLTKEYYYEPDGRKNELLPQFRQKTTKVSDVELSEWLSGGTSVRSICSQGDKQRAAGSHTPKSTQGQQMTEANWKTNEKCKCNLDSGVAVYLRENVWTQREISSVSSWCWFLLYWPRFWLVQLKFPRMPLFFSIIVCKSIRC